MIYLHTGLPGAGKTLYTLDQVRKRAESENRTVYYHGIELTRPDMFPGWELLDDPKRWHELPDGAIIVHDECQTLYRPRGAGAAVPDYVQKFETHRHQGYDIYLITQHPMLVDGNIRRLAGEHVHVVRAFGAGFSVAHRWQQVNERCDKSRKDSVTETYSYNRQLFDAYKSATIHTHKRKIPAKVFFLLAVPFLLIGLVWLAFESLTPDSSGVPGAPGAPGAPGVPSAPGAPGSSGVYAESEEVRLMSWYDQRQPRIAGLPHTAPVYDRVTEPTRAPVPAACVSMGGVCRCYSQQGTRLDTAVDLCQAIVERGYFVDFDPDGTTSEGRADQPDSYPRPVELARTGAGSRPASR